MRRQTQIPRCGEVETTLWELIHTIREVSSSDEEAFCVLEAMLLEGRLSVSVCILPQTSPA